jgi:Zn-dependent M28 family amino/carboxypeptidase
MIRMPGRSFVGAPPPLTSPQLALRQELERHVMELAGEIGERNLAKSAALEQAAKFIECSFSAAGYAVSRDVYEVDGRTCRNIAVEVAGTGPEFIVVGAHYDTVPGSPGANDNGSGVAGMLALARIFSVAKHARTIRFVAFVNEEPGHFQTAAMGSYVYASRCKAKHEQVHAMISLETIGYFSDRAGSQNYPVPGLGLIYPDAGNFIAFVGDIRSRALVRKAIGAFRRGASIPSEGAALPGNVPGVGWSDHWSFWQHGYRALMITDTAPFRYPHYHSAEDTPDKLDYASMTRVVDGLRDVVAALADAGARGD